MSTPPAPLSLSTGLQGPASQAPDELASMFESLGNGCEFGIVQRVFGSEPLGLLRFSLLPHKHLLSLLGSKFADIDAPDGIETLARANDEEWWISIPRYGIEYHTFKTQRDVSREVILEDERIKIAFLKRKLVDQLEDPEKIFVRAEYTRSHAEMQEAFRVLRNHGSHSMLWVTAAETPEQIGTVALLENGLVHGYFETMQPCAIPTLKSIRAWSSLLEGACDLLGRKPEISLRPDEGYIISGSFAAADIVTQPNAGPMSYLSNPVLRHTVVGNQAVSRPAAVFGSKVRHFQPGAIYTASAWIYFPEPLEGSIWLTVSEMRPIWAWNVDTRRAGEWQRIVVSARASAELSELSLALMISTYDGSSFLSSGWRFERGPVPRD